MTDDGTNPTALGGLRVVEIGDAPALSYAGKLLAEFGADVVKVELPGGDSARRRIPLAAAPTADGALHRWINSSKRSLVLDWSRDTAALAPLLDAADAVISAVPAPGAPGAPDTAVALTVDALRADRPHLIAAHVSDFGPDGPMAGWQGGELILYALSGLLAASGAWDRPPVAHGTGVAWYTAGAALAVGVLIAHRERLASGHGQGLDVAGLDAMVGAQAGLPFIAPYSGVVVRRAAKTKRVDLGVLPCSDGYIASVVGREGWEPFVAMLDEPELLEERFLDRARLVLHMDEAMELVLRRLKQMPRDHWFHEAQALRLPFAKVQSAKDIAECPQLEARGYFQDVTGPDGIEARVPGRPFILPAAPWRMTRPAPLLGDTAPGDVAWDARPEPAGAPGNEPPLRGIRILELGTAWAGPCGTKIFADLGADVIKVESPTRPDNARVPPFTDSEVGERFWDRCNTYLIANSSKAHLALELSTPFGQDVFKRLVAGADVVWENYTPRVMRAFGLGYDELRAVRPDLIMLSSCGYGQTGPWSSYAAYGWSLEPGSGIADVTGYEDGPPVASAIPYPDMAGALHGAFAVLSALEHRRKTGEGQYIDLAQYELGALSAVAPLLQYLANGERWGRHGNRHPWYAPHNIYPSAPDGTELGREDNWLAIAIEDDAEWPRLVKALDGALEDRPEYATFAGRKANEDAIDAQIAAWSASRVNTSAAEYLQSLGVRAAPVNRYDEVIRLQQLWHRRYLVRAQHQESGVRIMPGTWQRFARSPGGVRWAASDFGSENELVLREILGIPAGELAAAQARGDTADIVTGLMRPPVAGLPMEQSIALGIARGKDPGYQEWNDAGPFLPRPEPLPFSWGTPG